jgi:PAS domain S-box-containing protein
MTAPAPLLAPRSRAWWTALVAVVAGVAFWLVDAWVGSLAGGRAFPERLLYPTAGDLGPRLLVPVLVAIAWRLRVATRRLHLFSSALAAAPDGIQIVALDGTIAYSNEAVRDIYGFSPEEFLGKHVNDLNADPALASRVILPALSAQGRWEGEVEVKHKDGHVFPIWLTTSIVMDRSGRPLAAIGVIRDITERKRAEWEMQEYARRLEEATAMKDLFADILRHDLLGPASTVQLSLEALLKRDADPETGRRMIEGAMRSCRKLTDMLEGAAKYAKVSAATQLEFEAMDLGAMLREIVAESELRQLERRARVVLEARGSYPVRASPVLPDVFDNLLSNALKYGPENGTIRIEVAEAGERWRVSVADQGEGIADADKEKLFTRFERLRKEGVKGTGLGLAIAKRVVDLHGGSIWVEDAPGGGAVFCVTLPRERDGSG